MPLPRPYERGKSWILSRRGLAYLEAGRPAEVMAAGDVPKARRAYQDLRALWKDADPDLPLLARARAEYAKLAPS